MGPVEAEMLYKDFPNVDYDLNYMYRFVSMVDSISILCHSAVICWKIATELCILPGKNSQWVFVANCLQI